MNLRFAISTLSAAGVLGTVALAQSTATYEYYGEGCNGVTRTDCLRLNDQNPVMTVASLPNEYAYPVVNTTGAAIQVVGFEIYTVSNTGGVETGRTGILWDVGGPTATVHTQPDATNIANGTITVGGAQGWYSTSVNPPITVPAGTAFWFHVDAYSTIAPPQHSTAGGVAGPTTNWWRRPNFSNYGWTSSVSVARQIFRIHCLPAAPAVPSLTVDQPPRLGQTITYTVGGGIPGGLGFCVFGFSGSQWAGMPTPVDLAFLGAPGCAMYTSTDIVIPMPLDPAGIGSVGLGVPATPGLAGASIYNQAGVLRPGVNPLGTLFSSAGVGVLGT